MNKHRHLGNAPCEAQAVSETFPREDNCLKSSSVSCKLQPHRTPAGIGIRRRSHTNKLGKIMAVEYDLVVIMVALAVCLLPV